MHFYIGMRAHVEFTTRKFSDQSLPCLGSWLIRPCRPSSSGKILRCTNIDDITSLVNIPEYLTHISCITIYKLYLSMSAATAF